MTARKKAAPKKAAPKKAAPKRRSPAKPRTPKARGLSSAALAGAVASGAGGALASGSRTLGTGLALLARSRDLQRFCAIGLLAAVLIGTSGMVRERVETWEQYQLHLGLRADAPPPPGLSSAATRDLAAIRLPSHVHAFHSSVVPSLARHLRGLPWVASVEELRLLPPAKLELKLRTHRPLAQLGSAGGPLVAKGGAMIPRIYGAHPERLPRLIGVPKGEGRPLALKAGIQVLQALGPLVAQVEAVDLSNIHGQRDTRESEIVLKMAGGLLVDWGRYEPIAPAGAEPGASAPLGQPRRDPVAKRADLEAFLASFPQIGLVKRVSIRFDEVSYTLRESPSQRPLSRR
ncbi:MAG: hypothetical protein JKY65_19620 [Planctomycetes bacterium]|nr:hypothetical protein [Planctomycetota bacterium]